MGLAASVDSDTRTVSDKQPGAYRTITEVAEDLDVPQHVLRFWESRFAQIRPLKRGGGRRYYRPDDVDLLRGVKRLLHGQGYTIRGAQRILKESGPRFVQAVGRGEANVGAPLVHERDPEATAQPGEVGAALSSSDRASLETALGDLRECRAILAALGSEHLGEA